MTEPELKHAAYQIDGYILSGKITEENFSAAKAGLIDALKRNIKTIESITKERFESFKGRGFR